MTKGIVTIALIFVFVSTTLAVEISELWGLVSFRERHEEVNYFYSDPRSPNFGNAFLIETNTKTRVGYQLGLKLQFEENLFAGITVRSGLGSVLWQDITNNEGLQPGIQEVYLDWRTPYANVIAGRIPQRGDAFWDLYAAHLQTDPLRTDDPRDGVFNDRVSALNGVKLLVPVGPVTLRGIFHTDFVTGKKQDFPEESSNNDITSPDKQVFLLGGVLDMGKIVQEYNPDTELKLDINYGLPYRAARISGEVTPDSTYIDEKLWGGSLFCDYDFVSFEVGYAYNWRDSLYTSHFEDYKLSVGLPWQFTTEWMEDLRVTYRMQLQSQQHEFGVYEGTKAIRKAHHLYLNKKIWNLDFQPRIIWFLTEIDRIKTDSMTRFELTVTARFHMK